MGNRLQVELTVITVVPFVYIYSCSTFITSVYVYFVMNVQSPYDLNRCIPLECGRLFVTSCVIFENFYEELIRMACIELYGGVHTAQKQRPMQISIHLAVSVSVSVSME